MYVHYMYSVYKKFKLFYFLETLKSVKTSMISSNTKRIRIPNQKNMDSPSGTSDSETGHQREKEKV